jgi:cellulose biosynthesis protein BcsQ
VLISCWSAKGGAGTTVVAAALAVVLARSSAAGALLVDLAGDAPAVLGLPDPGDPGLAGWLLAGADVPADALTRLELDVGNGLSLLPSGSEAIVGQSDRAEVLTALLAADGRPVVADCGRLDRSEVGVALAAGATHSLLVTRACYLALRRASTAAVRPSGVVLVKEAGRALGRADVEQVVGAPVRAEIAVDPAIARAVDAGVLCARLPRGLERALRHAA